VIKGPLIINSQAAVTGTGVTFYLTGSQAGFTIAAGAALSLEARRPATTAASKFSRTGQRTPAPQTP